MSFLTEIRERAKKGPGSITVRFSDGKEVVVPLRYPKAIHQAELVAFFNKFDQDASDVKMIEQNMELNAIVVRACIKTNEKITDDELDVLIRESGGYQGDLVRRCSELMGLGDKEEAPKRGRKRPVPANDGGAGSGKNNARRTA